MARKRKHLNIFLLLLTLMLGGVAICITGQQKPALSPNDKEPDNMAATVDTVVVASNPETGPENQTAEVAADTVPQPRIEPRYGEIPIVRAISFADIEPRSMTANHPFKAEALKVLSGKLEESDSLNRHQILSYCEHLRTAYTTRDIDFIRQVYSDNALIIVGHVVKTGKAKASDMNCSERVKYSIRTKKEYLENLERIFNTKKKIDVKFSDFRIMRHPTMEGIYGVILRQNYVCDSYSDDGYLFLLWDFRDRSMPLIHVRTWQPAPSLSDDGEIIDISDFNLE